MCNGKYDAIDCQQKRENSRVGVDPLVMPWPWNEFPEDESTWEQCVKEHAGMKKDISDFISEGKWVSIAYARLGRCRDNMTDEEIRTVQLFLGPFET